MQIPEPPAGPPSPPGSEPAGPVGSLDLSVSEVKQLYEFLDGAIMVPDVRYHLWRSWGFCARHTWAYAIVELELGLREPFSLTLLYEDLTERAARLLQSRRRPSLILRRLRAGDSCFTCDYVAISRRADPHYRRHHICANRRLRTRQLLAESRPIWKERSCPLCLGGQGLPCRLHLLAGATPLDRDLGRDLDELAERVERLHRSFTWRGPRASADDRAAWVEALGWFAGWDFPERALGEAPET